MTTGRGFGGPFFAGAGAVRFRAAAPAVAGAVTGGALPAVRVPFPFPKLVDAMGRMLGIAALRGIASCEDAFAA